LVNDLPAGLEALHPDRTSENAYVAYGISGVVSYNANIDTNHARRQLTKFDLCSSPSPRDCHFDLEFVEAAISSR
jgi:hypothetical protein